MRIPLFTDRADAGRQLATQLDHYRFEHPLILALPRGGVPVGYEVAKALAAPLDTLAARKIGAPGNPEYGIAAIAPGDVIVVDHQSLERYGLTEEEVYDMIEHEMREMERRIIHYRSGSFMPPDSVADTIIIVDDGLATGLTALAAIEAMFLQQRPHRLVYAAPICSREAIRVIEEWVEVVCVRAVDDLGAISRWYKSFPAAEDDEVIDLLERAAKEYQQSRIRELVAS